MAWLSGRLVSKTSFRHYCITVFLLCEDFSTLNTRKRQQSCKQAQRLISVETGAHLIKCSAKILGFHFEKFIPAPCSCQYIEDSQGERIALADETRAEFFLFFYTVLLRPALLLPSCSKTPSDIVLNIKRKSCAVKTNSSAEIWARECGTHSMVYLRSHRYILAYEMSNPYLHVCLPALTLLVTKNVPVLKSLWKRF